MQLLGGFFDQTWVFLKVRCDILVDSFIEVKAYVETRYPMLSHVLNVIFFLCHS